VPGGWGSQLFSSGTVSQGTVGIAPAISWVTYIQKGSWYEDVR
jgi:hypothetical protein